MVKNEWIYGENKDQKYYEYFMDDGHICLFANKYKGADPTLFMCVIERNGISCLQDKTFNDRQRRKYKTPAGENPPCTSPLQSRDLEYMKRKSLYAYKHGKKEISA